MKLLISIAELLYYYFMETISYSGKATHFFQISDRT